MWRFCYGFTVPVNPAGASSVLTHEQLWKALKIKSRSPTDFVPEIEESTVVEERANGIVRRATFVTGVGLSEPVDEEITYHGQTWVDFYMPKIGTRIANIITVGATGELYLTSTFDWPFPDIAADSSEVKAKYEEMIKMADNAVQHTIDVTRQMVAEGKLD